AENPAAASPPTTIGARVLNRTLPFASTRPAPTFVPPTSTPSTYLSSCRGDALRMSSLEPIGLLRSPTQVRAAQLRRTASRPQRLHQRPRQRYPPRAHGCTRRARRVSPVSSDWFQVSP